MAYEIVGLKPKSHLGICVRMNIWSWPEFLEILFICKAINFYEKKQLLLNDCGIVFDEARCKEMSDKIFSVAEYLETGIERAGLDGYKEFINTRIENGKKIHIRGSELILAYLFIDNCGGFYIR